MSESAIAVLGEPGRVAVMRQALDDEAQIHAMVGHYMAKQMVEGTDYGKIPGTEKPTLLKPGAEKLVSLFRCTPRNRILKIEEDFERGFFNYVIRVRLVSESGRALAEGLGSANSREGRYRWRNANRKCPKCGKETIIAGKKEYGGGFLCFLKKGGCGAKFGEQDKSITDQQTGQVENDDIATLANTILKMAKKRALVDGAIALARCSDLFTQDVEDLMELESVRPTPVVVAAPPAAQAPKEAASLDAAKKLVADAVKGKLKPRATMNGMPVSKAGPIVDVAEGQTEDEAKVLARRRRRIRETGQQAGYDASTWPKEVLLPALGADRKHDQWTAEDCDKLEKVLGIAEPPVEPGAQG